MDSRLLWTNVLVPRVSIIEGFYCIQKTLVKNIIENVPTSTIVRRLTSRPIHCEEIQKFREVENSPQEVIIKPAYPSLSVHRGRSLFCLSPMSAGKQKKNHILLLPLLFVQLANFILSHLKTPQLVTPFTWQYATGRELAYLI